jgi:hypothetical protein
VYQVCFQCTILVHETYELWMNEFYTISITKSWDAKFVMCLKAQQQTCDKGSCIIYMSYLNVKL